MSRRNRPGSIPQTIGGLLVGFDEQTWSRRPPAQERVEQIGRLATLVTPGGLTIELPTTAADGPSTGPEGAQDREAQYREAQDRDGVDGARGHDRSERAATT